MKKFGLLTTSEIECRLSQTDQYGVNLLLYKTSRTDANILDRVVGENNWQNDFKMVGDVLYGGIGIRQEDGSWLWKWDAGSESNIEKEKGEASDAFKRAGFKWGIGRELYTSPKIRFRASDVKINDKGKCYDTFTVTDIGYDKSENICRLTVLDENTGKKFVWDSGTGEPKEDDSVKVKETISTPERKMLFDLGKKLYGDRVTEVIKQICDDFGYEKTADITKEDYPKIMEQIQAYKVPA